MIRPVFVAALVLTGAVATPFVLVGNAAPKSSNAPATSSNGQGPKTGPDETRCEVTGVHTSYNATYAPAPGGDYRISSVDVAEVDASCAGANLELVLLDGTGNPISTETTLVESQTVVVTVDPTVAAKALEGARVNIVGGTTPVPAECGSFSAARRKFGTFGPDDLAGTSLSDLMYGLAGDDIIRGGPNPDCIDGGDGADTLFGEAGDDFLIGQAGGDTLEGGNGKDRLFGGGGNDLLRGGSGNDHLEGGDGNDHLEGGVGNDTCIGGDGDDTFDASCESISQ